MAFVLDNSKRCEICYEEYDNSNYQVLMCPHCNLIVCKNCALELIRQNFQNNFCEICKKPFKIEELNLPIELIEMIKKEFN